MNHEINSIPSSFYLISLHSSKKNKDLLDKNGDLRSDIRRNIDYSIVSKEAWNQCKKDYDIEVKVKDVHEVFISFSCNGLSFKSLYVHGVERVFDVIQTLFVNKTFGIDYFKEMFEIKHEKKVIDPNVNFEYFGDTSKKIVLFVEKKKQIKEENSAILESSIVNDEFSKAESMLSDLTQLSSLKNYFDDIKFYESIYTIKDPDNDLYLRSFSLPKDNKIPEHDNICQNFNNASYEIDNQPSVFSENCHTLQNKKINEKSAEDSHNITNKSRKGKDLDATLPQNLKFNKQLNESGNLNNSIDFAEKSNAEDIKAAICRNKTEISNNGNSDSNLLYQTSSIGASCPMLNTINEIPHSHLKLFSKIENQKCIGIPNIGNSCYMNSSIQCLNNCALFSNFFFIYNSILRKGKTDSTNSEKPFLELCFNTEFQKNFQIISSWSDFITHLKVNLNLSPRILKNAIGKRNSAFSNTYEQDAAEFIEALLSYLHEGLCYNKRKLLKFLSNIDINSGDYEKFYRLIIKNYSNISEENESSENSVISSKNSKCDDIQNKKAYNPQQEFRKLINFEKSIISELFYGMFTNTLECQKCKFKKFKSELMMFLPLPIPNRVNYHSSCTLLLKETSVPKKVLIPLSYSMSEAIEYTKVEYDIQNSILALEYDEAYPINVIPLSKNIASIKNRIIFFEFDGSKDYTFCHLFYIKYFFYKKKISTDFIIETKDFKLKLYEKLKPFFSQEITCEKFQEIIEIKKIENSHVLNIPTYTIVLKDITLYFHKILDILSPCYIDKKDDISLSDCLNHYFKDEFVDLNCENCKSNTKYLLKSKLTRLPKYLIIHLKRFSYSSNNTKINTFIDFPENCLKTFGSKYKLIATANHIEIGMGYGHYTAYIKKIDGWYCCNDSVISRTIVPDKATAYILFYEKFE